MKKRKLLLMAGALFFSIISYGQFGVNTLTPAATLDVVASNETGNSTGVDGVLFARVDRQRAQSMKGIPVSTLIYVNNITTGTAAGIAANIDALGFYYFNGTAWTKLISPGSGLNIYNSNGTLDGNRIVTQGDKTLAFTGTKTNAFSVDGATFSVDAANDRVGIGTASPQNKLDMGSSAGNNVTDVAGKKLAIYNNASGTDFYGLGVSPGILQFHASSGKDGTPQMILKNNGNVGIGTSSPATTLEITANNATGTNTNVDGILLPRVDRQRAQSMVNIPVSTMIYINSITTGTQTGKTIKVDAVGYYYYDGSVWVKFVGGSSPDGSTFYKFPIAVYNYWGNIFNVGDYELKILSTSGGIQAQIRNTGSGTRRYSYIMTMESPSGGSLNVPTVITGESTAYNTFFTGPNFPGGLSGASTRISLLMYDVPAGKRYRFDINFIKASSVKYIAMTCDVEVL